MHTSAARRRPGRRARGAPRYRPAGRAAGFVPACAAGLAPACAAGFAAARGAPAGTSPARAAGVTPGRADGAGARGLGLGIVAAAQPSLKLEHMQAAFVAAAVPLAPCVLQRISSRSSQTQSFWPDRNSLSLSRAQQGNGRTCGRAVRVRGSCAPGQGRGCLWWRAP